MKVLSFIVLLLCIVACTDKETTPLFRIVENEKIGFIDSTGRVVIRPQFHAAGEFSEGLSNARFSGKYGFIDETGKFVIKPQFEFAESFSNGLARVYLKGKSYFIDPSGTKFFDCHFAQFTPFKNDRSIVKTSTGKLGAIDKKGKLFIDTIYSEIGEFEYGQALVKRFRDQESAVIDTLGKTVIPFKKYANISYYKDGIFCVFIRHEKDKPRIGFLDRNCKLFLSIPYQENVQLEGTFKCGLLRVSFWKVKADSSGNRQHVQTGNGYIDLEGLICIKKNDVTDATDFSENRAFVRGRYNMYTMIDRKGKKVSKHQFDEISGEFKNGTVLVRYSGNWGLIDTNGKYIIPLRFPEINQIGMVGDYFFYGDYNEKKKKMLTGVVRKDGKIIVKNILEDIDQDGFVNGLLKCVIDGRLTYINQKGYIVWQEKLWNKAKKISMNIDYMLAGHFYADPALQNEKWWWSVPSVNNGPRLIQQENTFVPGALSIHVESKADTLFEDKYVGYSVSLANKSGKMVSFQTQDHRLDMIVQARNQQGEWKNIEYLPSSWCGNSYSNIDLKSGYYWQFTTPRFDGEFNTKCRIALKYINPDPELKNQETTLFSNEFDGSVNLSQFWRIQNMFSSNLMNPYY
jgi:hypothetical protein